MRKIDIFYIGFSETVLLFLLTSELFSLKAVITQPNRLDVNSVKNLIQKRDIPLYVVSKKSELYSIMQKIPCKIALMYKFGIIIPNKIVECFSIYNIHPGDLRTNRGAHPLNWTILLNEKHTCISLYKLGSKIDLGLLIESYDTIVTDDDDTITLEKRLECGIGFLLDALYEFLCGKREGEVIDDGCYRRKMRENDYTINLYNDSLCDVSRKIRSQKAYNGAVLKIGNFRFYVTSVEYISN